MTQFKVGDQVVANTMSSSPVFTGTRTVLDVRVVEPSADLDATQEQVLVELVHVRAWIAAAHVEKDQWLS